MTAPKHCSSPGCWSRVKTPPKLIPLAHVHDHGCVPTDPTRDEVADRIKQQWRKGGDKK